jgi:hypothetical protein
MPETDLNEVELGVALETLGYGGALEKFNVEWENLLHNILDINVPATAKRKITLTVLVTPKQLPARQSRRTKGNAAGRRT